MSSSDTRLPRFYWFLIDGLPHWLMRRYLENPETARLLPAFASICSEGRIRPLLPVWPNCQTPPSLSTLWTGLGQQVTGITGYELPDAAGAWPLAVRTAFKERPENIRWLWELYAEVDLPLRLCHIPFVTPSRLGKSARSVSYGFVQPLQAPEVLPAATSSADKEWAIVDLGNGIRSAQRTWSLHGQAVNIKLGAWVPEIFGDRANETLDRVAAFPLLASSTNKLYRTGKFGSLLSEGGNGDAERLFVSAIEVLMDRYFFEFLDAVRQNDSELVVGYQPAIDLALHELAGYFDTGSRFWTRENELLVDGLMLGLLQRADNFISEITQIIDPTAKVLVTSDHGMGSIDTLIYPNIVLRDLGWLATSDQETIEPNDTVCFFHPAETGELWLDPVLAYERGLTANVVFDRICEVLSQAPGGTPRIHSETSGAPGRFSVRAFLEPALRQQAKASLGKPHRWSVSRKTGEHGSHSADTRLHGVVIDLSQNLKDASREPIEAHHVASSVLGRRINEGLGRDGE